MKRLRVSVDGRAEDITVADGVTDVIVAPGTTVAAVPQSKLRPLAGRRAPKLSRYLRRHGHKVVAVDFTTRSAYPKRRERKIIARIGRAMIRRGIA